MGKLKDWRDTTFIAQSYFTTNGNGSDLHLGMEGVTKSFSAITDLETDVIEISNTHSSPVAVAPLLSDN